MNLELTKFLKIGDLNNFKSQIWKNIFYSYPSVLLFQSKFNEISWQGSCNPGSILKTLNLKNIPWIDYKSIHGYALFMQVLDVADPLDLDFEDSIMVENFKVFQIKNAGFVIVSQTRFDLIHLNICNLQINNICIAAGYLLPTDEGFNENNKKLNDYTTENVNIFKDLSNLINKYSNKERKELLEILQSESIDLFKDKVQRNLKEKIKENARRQTEKALIMQNITRMNKKMMAKLDEKKKRKLKITISNLELLL